jgi:dCTP deaminase
MGLLTDRQIRELAQDGMITPFAEGEHRPGVVSYGLTSCGYDVRVADEFKVFTNAVNPAGVVDVKAFDPSLLHEVKADRCVIPPNSYALARSVERFVMPDDVLVVCVGKSTYARAGIIVNVTPLEPAWEGWITIEISNATPCPVVVYANEGIMQALFFRADERPGVTYKTKHGKYQDQAAHVVPPVVR